VATTKRNTKFATNPKIKTPEQRKESLDTDISEMNSSKKALHRRFGTATVKLSIYLSPSLTASVVGSIKAVKRFEIFEVVTSGESTSFGKLENGNYVCLSSKGIIYVSFE
jgi:hypothetical protein